MILPLLGLLTCNCLNWLKGHAKILWGLELSPFYYWLLIGLPTTYIGLWSWWALCEKLEGNIWVASCYIYGISLLVTLTLNTLNYGFNPKAGVALSLIVLAGIIAK